MVLIVEPPDGLCLTWQRGSPPPRLVASGDIDLVTETRIEVGEARACAKHPTLILDLSAVTFISNGGSSTLFRHYPDVAAVIVGERTLIRRACNLR